MFDLAAVLVVVTGFLLGLAHSLDPDHVVAVSTLLCSQRSWRKSIVSATAWGVGHSVVLIIAGLFVLILRVAIPDSVAHFFELAAAAMLIALGIWVTKPLLTHRSNTYTELDNSTLNSQDQSVSGNHSHSHVNKSIFTGVLQGLAGSAAIMLVILTTVNSTVLGLIFILLFGAGVILGMVSIACVISSVLNFTASRVERVNEKIRAITGAVSVAFGVFIIVQTLLEFHL